MRITYRTHGVKDYWAARWSDIPADEPMENFGVYPLKYAEKTVKDKAGKILEGSKERDYEISSTDLSQQPLLFYKNLLNT